jgi:2-isopropylmalate synthase
MRNIAIFDTTLRDGEQSPGVNLNTREKVDIALQLERLRVDRIEAGFPIASPGDLASVQAVAQAVRGPTIVGLARARTGDIDAVFEALRGASDACIHVFLATSPIHRQHKLRMTKEQVLETARAAITYAKKYFSKVQFSPEDAGRTEIDYLCEVATMAVEAGATVLNIPDTVGYLMPEEYGRLFRVLRESVPGIERVQLSAHCHDDLGLATANALAAIVHGADQIEGTINGIGERAGNTAIEEVALALHTRAALFEAKTSLALHEIYPTSRLVSKLTGMIVPGNKALVGANAFAHESGIHQDGMLKDKSTYEIIRPETIGLRESQLVLGKHSGRHAFREKLLDLGITLSDEALDEAFASFKRIADQKKTVTDEDVRTIIGFASVSPATTFRLDALTIRADEQGASVEVRMGVGDELLTASHNSGNGIIDSMLKAIEIIADEHDLVLEDYIVKSVSHDKDALGECHVQVRSGGDVVTGRGYSTDVITASALAYIDAIHRVIERRQSGSHKRDRMSLL